MKTSASFAPWHDVQHGYPMFRVTVLFIITIIGLLTHSAIVHATATEAPVDTQSKTTDGMADGWIEEDSPDELAFDANLGKNTHIEIGGFAQANYAARVTGAACFSNRACDFPLGEERLQLKLEAFAEDGSAAFSGKVDFFHDAITNQPGIELRETYLDLISQYITLRIGRQIITWGVGDLLFINDIFPKDWVAFFTGRPMQYLKVGSDAVKIDVPLGFLTAEFVLAPFFQPDRYPKGERLIVADPFPSGLSRETVAKKRALKNMEFSAKLSTYLADWEVALYISRTFYRTPAAALDNPTAPTKVHFFFPRLNTFGVSASGGLLGGILSLEGAYYDSQRDRDGTDPTLENSQVKGLVGYNHPLWEDAILGIQGYAEWMQNHSAYIANHPAGFPRQDALRLTSTVRFTQRLFHQTLTLNMFLFFGVTDMDAYMIPSLRYAFTDALWAEIGGNVFLAVDESTMFGRFDKNSNIYFNFRYGF